MQLIGSKCRLWMVSVTLAALAALAVSVAHPSTAQQNAAATYPTRPIHILVGFGAGGGSDLLARIVAHKLAENIGQPVVVENKPGGGGRLAVEYAQGQAADGYTLVMGATGQMAIAPAIYPKLPYHPTRTLIPLTMVASYPLIIAGQPGEAIRSVPDLVAWAKANPGRSNYPTSSPAFTIPIELFKLRTGMPAQAVFYKSTSEMTLSIVSGQTVFGIADPSSVIPLIRAGKLRALAVSGATRSTELPEVPTLAEAGLADVDIRLQWLGLFVHAGTPAPVARKLETELRRALADPGVREKIKTVTYDPGGGPGDEFARLIDEDIKVYSDVIKAANLKFE